jgi:phospholipase/carboxylesterase
MNILVKQSRGLGPHLTRRRFLGQMMAAFTATIIVCPSRLQEKSEAMTLPKPNQGDKQTAKTGRLSARWTPPAETILPGLHPLGLSDKRDGLLYVPVGYHPDRPAPLVVLLHGAGGVAQHALSLFQALADEAGLLLLAPDSRGRTWDFIINNYGPDIAFIDQALAQGFNLCMVDPAHLAVGGFSDGASYALSIGLINGDLFSHIIAFSPGFMAPTEQNGSPQIFISHGIHDDVLPIDRCSRKIVPQLQRADYKVRYREFDGPHTVPLEIVTEAKNWFLMETS